MRRGNSSKGEATVAEATLPACPVPIESYRPHITGNAQCRRCAHGWVAIIAADANLWLLECPRCRKLFGHVVGAFPESPYQAKVWSEEMWRYLCHEELPGESAGAQSESPNETDGDVGSAGSQSTSGENILTVNPSRWTTSSQDSLAVGTASTTYGQHTGDAMHEEDGDQYVDDCGEPRW